MKKNTNKTQKPKNPFLQKQYDEKEFATSFNFIISKKGVDSTIKLVLNLMCNDIYMNGAVTWKQNTYADKLGLTRQQICKIFQKLEDLKILVPESTNKAGAKNNRYGMNGANLPKLVKVHNGFKKGEPKKKDDSGLHVSEEPVNPGKQTCKPPFTQPVNPGKQTCKPPFTYNTNNTCIKHVIQDDVDDFFIKSSSSGSKESKEPNLTKEEPKEEGRFTQEEIDELLKDLDI